MALGANTLSVTIDGNAKVLRRINQDNFVTRYFLHEGTGAITAVVRHTKETRAGVKYDLHNIELQQEIFATPTTPGINRFCWFAMRNVASDDHTDFAKFAAGLLGVSSATGNVGDLLAWVG